MPDTITRKRFQPVTRWNTQVFKLLRRVNHPQLTPGHRLNLVWNALRDTVENRLVQITSIEVKASATVDGKDFKGLRHLQATEGAIFQHGMVLYAGCDLLPFGENLWAAPLSMWWAEPAAPQLL